jgi:hypothetical protein
MRSRLMFVAAMLFLFSLTGCGRKFSEKEASDLIRVDRILNDNENARKKFD